MYHDYFNLKSLEEEREGAVTVPLYQGGPLHHGGVGSCEPARTETGENGRRKGRGEETGETASTGERHKHRRVSETHPSRVRTGPGTIRVEKRD